MLVAHLLALIEEPNEAVWKPVRSIDPVSRDIYLSAQLYYYAQYVMTYVMAGERSAPIIHR